MVKIQYLTITRVCMNLCIYVCMSLDRLSALGGCAAADPSVQANHAGHGAHN